MVTIILYLSIIYCIIGLILGSLIIEIVKSEKFNESMKDDDEWEATRNRLLNIINGFNGEESLKKIYLTCMILWLPIIISSIFGAKE